MLRLLLITKLIFGRCLKICLYSAYIVNLIFNKGMIFLPLLKKDIYKLIFTLKARLLLLFYINKEKIGINFARR